MKILILGYSKIVRKRVLNVIKNKKIKLFIASKTYKKKIPGAKKQFNSYETAIKKVKPNLVYISLPNSKHYFWAKKSLYHNFDTIVDKPITTNKKQLKDLIELSNKNKKILVEATYFNYHQQFRKIKNIYKKEKYKNISTKFIIPTPDKKSILISKKFQGGVFMDMGPYMASLPRLFKLKNVVKKKVEIFKNKKNLIIAIKFIFIFKEGKYYGLFKFGGRYKNEIKIHDRNKIGIIKRAFSPPDNENMFLKMKIKNKELSIKFKKDDCFRNFFNEVLKKIKTKEHDFYHKRMIEDCNFRFNLMR